VLAWEAQQSGLPMLRPLMLEFQEDSHLAGVEDQALLGAGLMICPVLEAGATQRRIRLPQGTWHDFWTQASWQGPGEIAYAAPLDRLPMLARGGTILPMGPVLQSIPDDHRFDEVQFHIWPPYPASGVLYEDDGASLDYTRGAWSITRLRAKEESHQLVIYIAPAEGQFPGQPQSRRVEFVIHRGCMPEEVMVNGQVQESWRFDRETSQLHLALVCPIDEGTSIQILQTGEK
jgi:alpha-glucosidase